MNHRLTLTSALLLVACGNAESAPSGPNMSGGEQSSRGGTKTAGGAAGPGTPNSGGTDTNGGVTGGQPSGAGNASGGAAGGRDEAGGGSSPAGQGGSTDSGGFGGVPNNQYWKPKAGLTWQWQLSEDVGTPLPVDVYDIDWEAPKATVEKLRAAGIKAICYVSVGSWEDYRPDAKDFPAAVIGKDYTGWPGEKYVDIRADALRAVISARFDVCKSKGFDAIEPDNMDVFELGSDSGFPLSTKDGVAYAKWLADAAHSRGMGIGQKNAASITADIAATYDWALTESCYSDGNWCGDVKSYIASDKPVFMCEYEAKTFDAACSAWKPKSYSPILKNLNLDAPITFCP